MERYLSLLWPEPLVQLRSYADGHVAVLMKASVGVVGF